jgi:cathepsin L
MSNQSYPYIDKDQSCNYDASKVIVKVQGTVAALRNPDGLK